MHEKVILPSSILYYWLIGYYNKVCGSACIEEPQIKIIKKLKRGEKINFFINWKVKKKLSVNQKKLLNNINFVFSEYLKKNIPITFSNKRGATKYNSNKYYIYIQWMIYGHRKIHKYGNTQFQFE